MKCHVLQINQKSQIVGRKSDISRGKKLKSHVSGSDCNCMKLKCFETISEADRRSLIEHFNCLKNKDEQDAILASLIEVHPVKRRRTRKEDPNEAAFHKNSYKYYVRQASSKYVEVCIKAFCSIFGVTDNRLRRIKHHLSETGKKNSSSLQPTIIVPSCSNIWSILN